MDEKNNIFNFEENERPIKEDLLKKAKEKSMLRMIVTSTVIATGIIGLLITLKLQITPLLLGKEIMDTHMYYSIYGANTYLGQWQEEPNLIGSNAVAPRYKLVDGVVVPIQEVKVPSKQRGYNDKVVNDRGEVYGINGERIMLFYHPNFEYQDYANDIEKLDEIREDKVVELALSFDKSYSFEEVEKMLPDNVTLNWSWVDSYDEVFLEEAFKGIELEPWTENEVAGIRSFEPWGEKIENPVENFVMDMEIALRSTRQHKETFLEIEKNLKNEKGIINPEQIGVLGVVVTGEVGKLKALEGKSFVKASSLGAIAEKY